MWIRSQDKLKLFECNAFRIIEMDKPIYEFTPVWRIRDLEEHPEYIGQYSIEGNLNTLGYYSTKEKAMKVLDMIQEKLYPPITAYEKADRQRYVFEMPKDEEVDCK